MFQLAGMAAHLPPPPVAWQKVACGQECLATGRGLTAAVEKDAMDWRLANA